MRKEYKLTVNDTEYKIVLEKMGTSSSMPPRKNPASVAAAPRPAVSAPAPAPAPVPAAAPSGGERVCAPLPGNVWKLKVKNGDTVKKGDVVVILEAMKMENEIMASCSGTICNVSVSEGQSIDTGALICEIK